MKNNKKTKVLLVLQKLDDNSPNKDICGEIIKNYVPKKSNLVFIHEIFLAKAFFNKKSKGTLSIPNIYHIYNLIPFIRFNLIRRLNVVIKIFLIWLLIVYSFIKNKNLVIFSDFSLYSPINKFNPKLYLLCPNLKDLVTNKQIDFVEMIRQVAIKSEIVFTTTSEETKEMKIFNRNVVQINN